MVGNAHRCLDAIYCTDSNAFDTYESQKHTLQVRDSLVHCHILISPPLDMFLEMFALTFSWIKRCLSEDLAALFDLLMMMSGVSAHTVKPEISVSESVGGSGSQVVRMPLWFKPVGRILKILTKWSIKSSPSWVLVAARSLWAKLLESVFDWKQTKHLLLWNSSCSAQHNFHMCFSVCVFAVAVCFGFLQHVCCVWFGFSCVCVAAERFSSNKQFGSSWRVCKMSLNFVGLFKNKH